VLWGFTSFSLSQYHASSEERFLFRSQKEFALYTPNPPKRGVVNNGKTALTTLSQQGSWTPAANYIEKTT
jgi:hypothetical protein